MCNEYENDYAIEYEDQNPTGVAAIVDLCLTAYAIKNFDESRLPEFKHFLLEDHYLEECVYYDMASSKETRSEEKVRQDNIQYLFIGFAFNLLCEKIGHDLEETLVSTDSGISSIDCKRCGQSFGGYF